MGINPHSNVGMGDMNSVADIPVNKGSGVSQTDGWFDEVS